MSLKCRVLLFDLGGVLIDFVGPERLTQLLGGRFTLSQVRDMWPDSLSLSRFELGKTSQQVFVEEFISEWNIEITPDKFIQEFSGWVRGPLPGALALLDSVWDKATLACLTNINRVYWERVRDEFEFGSRFDRCYASHEMGLLKPDVSTYEYVLSDLSCKPEDVVFFDDTQRNVDAAEALGIRAYRTCGVSELKASLQLCVYF